MALPKKINVLGREYSVKYCDSTAEVNAKDEGHEWGNINFKTSEIRIFKHNSDFATMQVIMHEVVHAYTFAMAAMEDWDEQKTDVLATLITDFIFRNRIDKWIAE